MEDTKELLHTHHKHYCFLLTTFIYRYISAITIVTMKSPFTVSLDSSNLNTKLSIGLHGGDYLKDIEIEHYTRRNVKLRYIKWGFHCS